MFRYVKKFSGKDQMTKLQVTHTRYRPCDRVTKQNNKFNMQKIEENICQNCP